MIIRRRHNGRFVITPNAMWEDRKLSAEAKGTLGYLLSRPHDWHVRQAHLGRVMGCGRERMQRIVNELIDSGYVERSEQERVEGGRFGTLEYIVRDEPQAENTTTDETRQSGNPESERPTPYKEREELKDRTSVSQLRLPQKQSREVTRPMHGDRGSIERQIATRIDPGGSGGFAVLMTMPESEVEALCARQRRGTLDEQAIQRLRARADP